MKIYKLFISISALALVSACKKDYLNLEPVQNYTYYNFMQNEGQAEQAVVACYRQLFPIYNNYMWLWGDMLSDNTSFRFNPSDRGGLETEKLDEFVAQSGESTIGNTYRDFYEGVTRSNYVLDNIDRIPFQSDSVKTIRIGEAKFFRAFHYFNLVRLFGEVPIVLKVLTDPDANTAANYPRKPVSEVYNTVIIPDALDAIAKLPATVPVAQKGRLIKAAAQMLLANAYLTQGQFQNALTNFNAVTGFSLNTNYTNNFNPATKNGVESILEIQTYPIPASAGGYSFGFMSQWAPWGSGSTFWPISNSRGGLNQPTTDLNNAYEANDVRKAVTIQSSLVATATVLGMKKFAYPSATNVGLNNAQWPIYRYAETVLGIAECLNETTAFPNNTAFTLLNQIRTRAGLPNKTQGNANPALAVNSQADFRLAIEKERRVEFAGEGHRWFDLLRTNRVDAVMSAHGTAEAAIKTTLNAGAYTQIKKLIAIPFREIQQFGYPQNPGW
jgi:starch-binding outer membrane protein, SusD/RagB family